MFVGFYSLLFNPYAYLSRAYRHDFTISVVSYQKPTVIVNTDYSARARDISVLQEIDGIGKKKRMALLEKFGTIDKIMSASIDELCQVEGIGLELAKKIYSYFREQI
jgi:ERCC4-type nuclease